MSRSPDCARRSRTIPACPATSRRCADAAISCASIESVGTPVILKQLVPSSLLGRSLLIMIVPLILMQVVSMVVFYDRHWTTVARQLAAGVAGDIDAVIEFHRRHPDPREREWLSGMAQRSMLMSVRLDEAAILPGTARDDTGDSLAATALGKALRERIKRPFRIDTTSYKRRIHIMVQLSEGVLHIDTPHKRLFTSTTYIFVLWMVGSSMILFGVATVFMRNQVRPIRRLAAATNSFGKGHDVPFFKPEGAAEVRQAGQAFNLMRERIRRQIDQRTEMLAGVSHDLRTPLTRMKLQLAMIGDVEGVKELNEDVDEMERMVDGYLSFARGEGTEAVRPANLTRILGDVVGRFRRNAGSVDLHVESSIIAPLRPNAIERCLTNLIGNAVRYADHVSVRAGQRDDAVEIFVDDDGPGIPPEKRQEVFRAFYRIEGSRNPATGGIGLGLTIALDVARSHGGDIFLEDSPLGGLRVRLRLPL
ncbi:MAG: HAMP domain-containing protein [Alphaproteobacteria bacterium]|nr:HAMP domain-containing protein [Alphaproteobacteria bacterium]